MVRVSKCNYTYVDSVTLPFKGASPSEVYRIAKTTKVLEVYKNIVLFRTTTIKYYDVYRYNTIDHKWEKDKDQKRCNDNRSRYLFYRPSVYSVTVFR